MNLFGIDGKEIKNIEDATKEICAQPATMEIETELAEADNEVNTITIEPLPSSG